MEEFFNALTKQIIPIIVLNLMLGFSLSGIDNAAHIGGLLGGIAVSFMLGINDKSEKSQRITGTILTVVLTAFMIYLAFFK